MMVKTAYKPTGSLGWSLSLFQWYEATKSISTPPVDGMLVHRRVTSSIKFTSTHLYCKPRRREALREQSVLPKNRTQCPWSGLQPGPLTPEPITVTTCMRPPRLPMYMFMYKLQCKVSKVKNVFNF